MPTIQDFKQIRSSVSPEVQADLYRLVIQDLNAAVERIIGIVNENGISFTAEEVRSYLREMDSKDEYDDIQLMKQHWQRYPVVVMWQVARTAN